MQTGTTKRSLAADPARLEHIENLLSRYPDISKAEREEIIHYLKRGPALDSALLSSIEHIKPKLARLREDHRSEFELGAREFIIVTLVFAIIIALGTYFWDAGLTQ